MSTRWITGLVAALALALAPPDAARDASSMAAASAFADNAAPPPPSTDPRAIRPRFVVGDASEVGTVAPGGGGEWAATARNPSGFVRSAAACRGRIWIGTFDAGLYVAEGSLDALARDPAALERARPVATPFRMINQVLEAGGALYVAANEGLFVSTDGSAFTQVPDVASRAVTGLAIDGHALYVTTTSALWRLRLDGRRSRRQVWWTPGGSRSVQGVVADAAGVWLASEDRGAIRFDGKAFAAYDKLAGLPTSWVLSVASDGDGGVFAATLRDGAMHIDHRGRWQRLGGLPSAWTLGVFRGAGVVCVGTQEGAACYDDPHKADEAAWEPTRLLAGLPDVRVHTILADEGGLLVATERGVAAYGSGP